MLNTTDSEEIPALIERLKNIYGEGQIESHSFDKGFYSKENKNKVSELAQRVIMPKKGKPNSEEQAEQNQPIFKKLRHAHSAVESNINSLEHHGLDRCPDKGLVNYNRYVGLGSMAYNLQIIGRALRKQKHISRQLRAKAA
jgi:hypothetical protein